MSGRRLLHLAVAVAVLSLLTFGARVADLNHATVGLLYVLAVLLLSIRGGLLVGMTSSVLATACYNYFFFDPVYTFTIAEPENWVALGTFLLTSIVVSRLVVAARVQAERAEEHSREVEALAVERERLLAESAHVEALRESDELKTSLLQAVSHDLSTPLTAIALHLEALRRHAAGRQELHETVVAIADETARLRRRIDNLLAMGRLEAGRIAPRPEPTPPADLFRAVRENLPLVFARRTVAVRVDEACPDAEVDPSLALEILVNLVENAHRAAPAGTSIELRAERHPADPSLVRLEVLDRGPGVASETLRTLGEPRGGAGNSDVVQRGLGLEIAHSFARASRGTLSLSGRPEGGTVARLELPAA